MINLESYVVGVDATCGFAGASLQENPADHVLRLCILFDNSKEHAFEEMYCTCCQVLDRMWDAMNASYMDFGMSVCFLFEEVAACVMGGRALYVPLLCRES